MLERHEEALASYNRAIEIKPDHYSAWKGRGGALMLLFRDEEAAESYERAIEIDPDNPENNLIEACITLCLARNDDDDDDNSYKASKQSSCFIATVAYSTSIHPDLDTFRSFRDEKLLPYSLGKKLVSL